MEKHYVFVIDPDRQSPGRQKWLADLAGDVTEEEGLVCVCYQSEDGNCLYTLAGSFVVDPARDCCVFNLADGRILEVFPKIGLSTEVSAITSWRESN